MNKFGVEQIYKEASPDEQERKRLMTDLYIMMQCSSMREFREKLMQLVNKPKPQIRGPPLTTHGQNRPILARQKPLMRIPSASSRIHRVVNIRLGRPREQQYTMPEDQSVECKRCKKRFQRDKNNTHCYICRRDPEYLEEQRIIHKQRTCENCTSCGNKLPPVGHARKNGKDHPDWKVREICKKCYSNR